jgi:hypothetical protein
LKLLWAPVYFLRNLHIFSSDWDANLRKTTDGRYNCDGESTWDSNVDKFCDFRNKLTHTPGYLKNVSTYHLNQFKDLQKEFLRELRLLSQNRIGVTKINKPQSFEDYKNNRFVDIIGMRDFF